MIRAGIPFTPQPQYFDPSADDDDAPKGMYLHSYCGLSIPIFRIIAVKLAGRVSTSFHYCCNLCIVLQDIQLPDLESDPNLNSEFLRVQTSDQREEDEESESEIFNQDYIPKEFLGGSSGTMNGILHGLPYLSISDRGMSFPIPGHKGSLIIFNIELADQGLPLVDGLEEDVASDGSLPNEMIGTDRHSSPESENGSERETPEKGEATKEARVSEISEKGEMSKKEEISDNEDECYFALKSLPVQQRESVSRLPEVLLPFVISVDPLFGSFYVWDWIKRFYLR
jgi:hypothetical protein